MSRSAAQTNETQRTGYRTGSTSDQKAVMSVEQGNTWKEDSS